MCGNRLLLFLGGDILCLSKEQTALIPQIRSQWKIDYGNFVIFISIMSSVRCSHYTPQPRERAGQGWYSVVTFVTRGPRMTINTLLFKCNTYMTPGNLGGLHGSSYMRLKFDEIIIILHPQRWKAHSLPAEEDSILNVSSYSCQLIFHS
jgi:hypothetical protein